MVISDWLRHRAVSKPITNHQLPVTNHRQIMIRSLVKLAFILIVGILIYNYFLGSPDEKATSKKIWKETKDLGSAIGGLLKSEKNKFDAGKYDKAVDKVGDLLNGLKSNANEFDEKYLNQIRELEQRKEDLDRTIKNYEANDKDTIVAKDSTKIKNNMKDLLRKVDALVKDMEKE